MGRISAIADGQEAEQFSSRIEDEIGAHFSAISKGAEAVLVLRASR